MILLAFGVAASIVMVADSYVKQVIADGTASLPTALPFRAMTKSSLSIPPSSALCALPMRARPPRNVFAIGDKCDFTH
jgi:hypothetical protein